MFWLQIQAEESISYASQNVWTLAQALIYNLNLFNKSQNIQLTSRSQNCIFEIIHEGIAMPNTLASIQLRWSRFPLPNNGGKAYSFYGQPPIHRVDPIHLTNKIIWKLKRMEGIILFICCFSQILACKSSMVNFHITPELDIIV